VTHAAAPERHWTAGSLSPAATSDGERRVLVEGTQLRTVVLRFAPGTSIPEHVHRASEEVFVVVAGTATLTIAGVPARCGPGDVLFAAAGEPHAIEVGAQPLVLLVVVAPNVHDSEWTTPPRTSC
jgi:quercetin dioxygenase-like cupin family protein